MNRFTQEEFDKICSRYSIGIDPIGIDGSGNCKGYVLLDKKGYIMAVVNAREFDDACKRFAKYYEKDSQLIDETTGKFKKL